MFFKAFINNVPVLVPISALALILTSFLEPLGFLRDASLAVFVVLALLLPWTKRTSKAIKMASLIGLMFFASGSLISDLGLLRLPAVILAVIMILAMPFLQTVKVGEGPDETVKSQQPDYPLNKPMEKRGVPKSYVLYFVSTILSLLNPFILVQIIGFVTGSALAFRRKRGKMPTPETFRQKIEYRLPFDGEWLAYNGGIAPETSHSWDALNQRYAYDFVVVDEEGHRHTGDGCDLNDYRCYGRPIIAPADGIVVSVHDGVRDAPYPGTLWIDGLCRDFRGNFVIIKHAEEEYSMLAHFIPGSIRVKAGEQVKTGTELGYCGNSGHSSEPHLHFHVQDHPNFFLGVGLPIKFKGVSVNGEKRDLLYIERGMRVAGA